MLPNKSDAGNGSQSICRVSNVLRSPSPDPKRCAKKMKIALWLISLISLIGLLAAIGYCWLNRSGHTAEYPYLGFAFFGLVFAIGLVSRMITRGRWLSARVTEVLGFVGMAFILFVTRLGILNQYDTWIAAGMPNRHPQSDLLLAGFLIGGLGGSLLVAYLVIPKEAQQDGTSNGG